MLGSKIETLLAVAEFQNFTKAAASLSLTQPAVSHHINQLEEELGVTLFILPCNKPGIGGHYHHCTDAVCWLSYDPHHQKV